MEDSQAEVKLAEKLKRQSAAANAANAAAEPTDVIRPRVVRTETIGKSRPAPARPVELSNQASCASTDAGLAAAASSAADRRAQGRPRRFAPGRVGYPGIERQKRQSFERQKADTSNRPLSKSNWLQSRCRRSEPNRRARATKMSSANHGASITPAGGPRSRPTMRRPSSRSSGSSSRQRRGEQRRRRAVKIQFGRACRAYRRHSENSTARFERPERAAQNFAGRLRAVDGAHGAAHIFHPPAVRSSSQRFAATR